MTKQRIGVVTFPGSLDDVDAQRAITISGAEAVPLWHASDDLHQVAAVVLPGGFSYGDYLRAGAIARFAPVMRQIIRGAQQGLPVLGICNGFQILCEAHLLPGALTRNAGQKFICRSEIVQVTSVDTVWSSAYQQDQLLTYTLKNGEGNFVADADTLRQLEDEGRVVFRYLHNPNGSAHDIAGITNERGNVVGLMPHPEHNIEQLTSGGTDGLGVFHSVRNFLTAVA